MRCCWKVAADQMGFHRDGKTRTRLEEGVGLESQEGERDAMVHGTMVQTGTLWRRILNSSHKRPLWRQNKKESEGSDKLLCQELWTGSRKLKSATFPTCWLYHGTNASLSEGIFTLFL